MHSCPICGSACYCTGDIEDHDTVDEYDTFCGHCEEDKLGGDGPEYWPVTAQRTEAAV